MLHCGHLSPHHAREPRGRSRPRRVYLVKSINSSTFVYIATRRAFRQCDADIADLDRAVEANLAKATMVLVKSSLKCLLAVRESDAGIADLDRAV